MIVRTKVVESLERKRTPFAAWLKQQEGVAARSRAGLENFLKFSAAEIDAELAERERDHVLRAGARPTFEHDRAPELCLPFGTAWQHHQDARAWALQTLTDRPVVAVDGSQIAPNKEYSMAVGALQIGWYINFHAPGGRYIKDVDFEVITPAELEPGANENDRTTASGLFPDWYLNQERFVRECDKLVEIMLNWREPGAKPLFLFDGSFVISFAGQMQPQRADPYVAAVKRLLEVSQALRMPLVAFVDSSYSRDLATLIDLLHGYAPQRGVSRESTGGVTGGLSDAQMLNRQLPLWGDRSPLFWCDRDDTLSRERSDCFYREVAFCYMRLSADRPPVRVEMPRWMVEEPDTAEEALCIVRAETVVGNGYPYAIETADALAVLRMEDRERFYHLFEQFAASHGLMLQRATKAQSKLGRR